MGEQVFDEGFKRHIAYKFRIGGILSGRPILEADKLRGVELGGKKVSRVNVVANIIDKYVQDGEKKYAVLTLDDATGQIKLKLFGDDIKKFDEFNQGDTVLVIGLLRSWNNEVYVTPEIIKKKDPAFLLVRKLEAEIEHPESFDKEKISQLKDKILEKIKNAEEQGGVDIENIILELKEPPELINQEIKKLLEDGIAYEPRPGKLRYLG